jgi:hypothetical protein
MKIANFLSAEGESQGNRVQIVLPDILASFSI